MSCDETVMPTSTGRGFKFIGPMQMDIVPLPTGNLPRGEHLGMGWIYRNRHRPVPPKWKAAGVCEQEWCEVIILVCKLFGKRP